MSVDHYYVHDFSIVVSLYGKQYTVCLLHITKIAMQTRDLGLGFSRLGYFQSMS